ncbi:LysR family transcriptional regulator [Enterobacter sp. BIGb0383]|uniref:LysR family transcriptional regulator n=1 Tax=unclassified Enterobacter TaxID=2608935 RepID=UPI000F4AD727|nr:MULTISPECIES: LysR family transcriptional regulator [unclassified Enterobacter]ROP58949.1 LysR family transcriptional regulator [Enterobacter sp. BIGb0383]ROS09585.1 LysR family transcriptional regulator [Enterobacter sp. BIGb0359]
MIQSEHVYRTDLKLLRYFLTVAEELHFGRAAARLNMSQPPLSMQIKELESQLGTALFIRNSRNVALTHAGKVLMDETRRLLQATSQALAKVEQIGRGESGKIELGIVGTALWGELNLRFQRFIQRNPTLDIIFREQSPDVQLQMLSNNELDIGIWRMATALPLEFSSLLLCTASYLVAMPTGHRLAGWDAVPLSELKDEEFITLRTAHSDWSFLQQVFFKAGLSPNITREVLEPQTVLALTSMGIGITLMPDSYSLMHWPGIVFRPLQERIPADLYLIYEAAKLTPARQRLIDALTFSGWE